MSAVRKCVYVCVCLFCPAEAGRSVMPGCGKTLHSHLQNATSDAITAGELPVCADVAANFQRLVCILAAVGWRRKPTDVLNVYFLAKNFVRKIRSHKILITEIRNVIFFKGPRNVTFWGSQICDVNF